MPVLVGLCEADAKVRVVAWKAADIPTFQEEFQEDLVVSDLGLWGLTLRLASALLAEPRKNKDLRKLNSDVVASHYYLVGRDFKAQLVACLVRQCRARGAAAVSDGGLCGWCGWWRLVWLVGCGGVFCDSLRYGLVRSVRHVAKYNQRYKRLGLRYCGLR